MKHGKSISVVVGAVYYIMRNEMISVSVVLEEVNVKWVNKYENLNECKMTLNLLYVFLEEHPFLLFIVNWTWLF